MSEKVEEIIRSYQLKNHSNINKLKEVEKLLFEYRKTEHKISNFHWRKFYENKEKFNDFRDIKHIPTKLSERYKQTCQTQVVGTLKSYISNTKKRYTEIIFKTKSIDEQTRIKLLYINKYNLWFYNEIKMKNNFIEKEIILIGRKLFKYLTRNHPTFNKNNMVLDKKVANVTENNSKSKFDYWIKMSTLTKGKLIEIPLQRNTYFENQNGIFKNAIQVNNKNSKIEFSLIKSLNIKSVEHLSKQLSLDLGNVVLLVNEHGDLIGRWLMMKIKNNDQIISKLFKNLKKQNVKPNDNKRYKRLIKKNRELMKNEIGRIVNKLVKKYHPELIKVEKLNFKNSKIGKKNNRILSNFGKQVLTKKLESISQTEKIKIELVNPAYTSQECNKCHHTEKKNRKTRNIFVCLNCGHKVHADVGSARNISTRSSSSLKQNKQEIFQELKLLNGFWISKRGNSSTKDVKEKSITKSKSKCVNVC